MKQGNPSAQFLQNNCTGPVVPYAFTYMYVGEKVARVMRPRRDTCSREVLRHKVPALCLVLVLCTKYYIYNAMLFSAYVIPITFGL